MNDYLRWGGGAILLLCALYIGKEYKRYVDRRIEEEEGFLAFLSHAREEIAMYLSPQKTLSSRFKNESLSKIGFLEEANRGGGLKDAFLECKNRLSIGKEAKELLFEFFSGFGQGYKEQEIKRIDSYSSRLSKLFDADRAELPKTAQMVSTLLLAGAVGVFILLL